MKLPLAYYGNPILRKKTSQVENINVDIRRLVENMIETMIEEDGIGLAAPQVHHSLAIFVMQVPIQKPDETWAPGLLRVCINPKIISYSPENWTASEACLSIPQIRGEVTRPLTIKLEATNLEGERFTEELHGLEARCALHENDHLNGTLFIDRIQGPARKALEPKLREIKRNLTKTK